VVALLDVVENVFGETWPKDCDAVLLGHRDPLVLDILPGTLCGERKHGELRAVVPPLPLFGIGTNKPD
jgi:hypothetical protein